MAIRSHITAFSALIMIAFAFFAVPASAEPYVPYRLPPNLYYDCSDAGIHECTKSTESTSMTVLGKTYTTTKDVYHPAVCKLTKPLLMNESLRLVSEYFHFSTKEECVAFCADKYGTMCKYTTTYTPSGQFKFPELSPVERRCEGTESGVGCFVTDNNLFYPARCTMSKLLGMSHSVWEPIYNERGFGSLQECAGYCFDMYKTACIYRDTPKTWACVAGDGIYACSPSGNDCSDAIGCEGRPCEQVYVTQCGNEMPGFLKPSDFGVVNVPDEAAPAEKPDVKPPPKKPSSCRACAGSGATWCENSADAREGYCTYNTDCKDEYFQRISLKACDAACTTSRDGIEPIGTCADVLKTSAAGGYFVSGLCQSRDNAAYQCFVGMESITGCQSCLESYEGAAWCKGTTQYCAFDSECIGDAVRDVTQCSDYQTAQYPVDVTPETASNNQPQAENGGAVETSDWFKDFMNWIGLA